MRPYICLALIAFTLPAWAQDLEGRTIVVEGNTGIVGTPVFLSYGGEAPEKDVVLRHRDSGVKTRATVTEVGIEFMAMAPGTYDVTLERKKKPRVSIEKRPDEDALEVKVRGDLVTVLHYGADLRKPYLWPVLGEGGAHITRDWPLGPEDKSKDHPHHTSFWTGYGDMNGADYWEFGERTGWQVVEDIEWVSGDAYGRIDMHIVWKDKDNQPVLKEGRRLAFLDTPASGRLFNLNINWTAAYGDVQIGDTKEGGLAGLRIADALRERGGSGTITNSAGGVGAGETWGKPAAWCDYSGTLEKYGARGVTIMDHPISFRHPTHWHVRNYGLMGTNPFGYSYFYDGEKNGEHMLKAGDSIAFWYRIYLHSGDVKEARVAETYQAFAEPPTARWAE